MGQWHLRIYENQQLLQSLDLAGPVELGRQEEGEEGPYAQRETNGRCRLVIARREEQSVSRKHALLEPAGPTDVQLTNLSTTLPIRLGDGREVKPGVSCRVALPAALSLGRKAVRVQQADDSQPLLSLAEVAQPPGPAVGATLFPSLAVHGGRTLDSAAVVRWLRATMGVFQSAASTSDFFARAAQAVVDMVGLDTGRVLLLENDTWQTLALSTVPWALGETPREPSRRMLARVRQEKRTFWELPSMPAAAGASLRGVTAVVAAPILDRGGAVIGALYGDRRSRRPASAAPPITELEALLVETLASGVAAGLARLEQERAALAAQVRFEQFVTPEIARQLLNNPDLLTGRNVEATLLFCDICGFSRVSERLDPTTTVAWVSDVMEALTECVRAEEGVLVNYVGDELIAMWGAPVEQADHARRACRAGLQMLGVLPRLNERWQAALQEPIELGVGVNTGVVCAGNTGSQYKVQYGPLGSAVNLASRVQRATRYLRTPMLLTGATREQLGDALPTRKLCTVRAVHIAQPVDLYEAVAEPAPKWADLNQRYGQALAEFERGDFAVAKQTLEELLTAHDDGPARVLLSRAIAWGQSKSAPFNSVWELPGK
jgi:adenylate cyclase